MGYFSLRYVQMGTLIEKHRPCIEFNQRIT